MLTGQLPFAADVEQALAYSILNENPRPVRQIRLEVPEALDQIIQKALAKRPEGRYQSVPELLSDLRLARGKEGTGGIIAAAEAVRRKKRRRLIRSGLISTAALMVILIGLLVVWPSVQEQLVASNPRIITVISFENRTGDKSQDHLRNVLQDAIITSLEQSRYIRVTRLQRIADILKQDGKKDVEYVDNELGLEICRREGAQLMAVGTFASAGELYRTTLRLVDVRTLETVKTYTASGRGAESLLEKQIDDLSREVSRGIGVSARQTEETIRPVTQISTSSLEAYQLYVRGQQEMSKGYTADARPFLEMAVQRDSLFAGAWFLLATVREDPKTANDALKKAISLAWRANERDRYSIALRDSSLRATLSGQSGITKLQFMKIRAERFPQDKEFLTDWANALSYQLEKTHEAIAVYKKVLELDPTYIYALTNLPYAYADIGDWENSIETLKRFAAASPGDANPYDSMGDIYVWRKMYDKATASYRQALAVKPSWSRSADVLTILSFVKEDYESALRWTDTSAARGRDASNQACQMWERALIAFWQGRLTRAEALLGKCHEILTKAGWHVEHGNDFLDIWIAYERGQFERSRSALDSWGQQYKNRFSLTEYRQMPELFIQMCRGFIELQAGMLDSVAACLARMDSIRTDISPPGTSSEAKLILSDYRGYARFLRSEWLMAKGHIDEAVAARPGDDPRYIASGPIRAWSAAFLPGAKVTLSQALFVLVMRDLFPRAYLKQGQLDSAIAAYERAISYKDSLDSPVFPRYHYRLAQVYEMKGLKTKAVAEYEKFLKIWGNADPTYKEPAVARARLATLKGQI
jgi:tetratricopeptide (TPR) repeat protein